MQTRKWTKLIMDAMDEGGLDPRTVADMCLGYMSEFDVADMASSNDLETLDPEYEE